MYCFSQKASKIYSKFFNLRLAALIKVVFPVLLIISVINVDILCSIKSVHSSSEHNLIFKPLVTSDSKDELLNGSSHNFKNEQKNPENEIKIITGENYEQIVKNSKLRVAVARGDLHTAENLINSGSNVNCNDEDGLTPLMIASMKGHETIINFLLDQGAKINAIDSTETTSLMWATKNGHMGAVKLLLDAGADLDALDNNIQNAIDIANKYHRSEIIKLLQNEIIRRKEASKRRKEIIAKLKAVPIPSELVAIINSYLPTKMADYIESETNK